MTSFDLPVFAVIAAFLMGTSKAGLKGLSVLNVSLMALSFGAFPSTGVIMPLLLVGDVFAVAYYHRHARWVHLFRFVPLMLIGIGLGTWLGLQVSPEGFRHLLAAIVIISLLLLIFRDLRIPGRRLPLSFTVAMGLLSGVTTMLGNLAGSFTNLYFLGLRLPKNEFIGTAAWLFLITNLVKLPLHLWIWKTIDGSTLLIDLKLLPFMLAGLLAGVLVVKKIPERPYRILIIAVTALGALLMLLG